MRTAVRCLFALLGCLHLAGGALGVLQLVAWSSMLVDYSQQDGLLAGARKTFDGEHPCELCLAIQQEREEPRETPLPVRDGDWKPIPLPVPIVLGQPRASELAPPGRPSSDSGPPGWRLPPPSPPPRRLA